MTFFRWWTISFVVIFLLLISFNFLVHKDVILMLLFVCCNSERLGNSFTKETTANKSAIVL